MFNGDKGAAGVPVKQIMQLKHLHKSIRMQGAHRGTP